MQRLHFTGPANDGEEGGSTQAHGARLQDDTPPGRQPPDDASPDDASPDDAPYAQPPEQRSRARRKRRPLRTPTRAQILAAIANLQLRLVKRSLSVAEVNTLLSIYKTLLAATDDRASPAGASLADASRLRSAIHEHPEILDALEPLLSDEQLADLVDDRDGDGGE